jgi:hypothetical protein
MTVILATHQFKNQDLQLIVGAGIKEQHLHRL